MFFHNLKSIWIYNIVRKVQLLVDFRFRFCQPFIIVCVCVFGCNDVSFQMSVFLFWKLFLYFFSTRTVTFPRVCVCLHWFAYGQRRRKKLSTRCVWIRPNQMNSLKNFFSESGLKAVKHCSFSICLPSTSPSSHIHRQQDFESDFQGSN